jgi:hypothetical protein
VGYQAMAARRILRLRFAGPFALQPSMQEGRPRHTAAWKLHGSCWAMCCSSMQVGADTRRAGLAAAGAGAGAGAAGPFYVTFALTYHHSGRHLSAKRMPALYRGTDCATSHNTAASQARGSDRFPQASYLLTLDVTLPCHSSLSHFLVMNVTLDHTICHTTCPRGHTCTGAQGTTLSETRGGGSGGSSTGSTCSPAPAEGCKSRVRACAAPGPLAG